MPPTSDGRDAATASAVTRLHEDLAGLDALELAAQAEETSARRAWRATWPKLAALTLGLGTWQAVVWSGWKPDYLFPGPGASFAELWDLMKDGTMGEAAARTMQRATVGFAISVVIGTVVGSLVARIRVLRAAVGSLITGIQTMPSVAWVPWAILLFGLSDEAILFVVVLGAAPAVANGLITGTDQIPPILLRAGRVLGARGIAAYRYVLLPASLPAFIGGLKQGWAFAWRSLMAGELLVTIGVSGVGFLLAEYRNVYDSPALIAVMIVILVIGIVVDAVVFGRLDRWVRRRHGLMEGS